MSADAPLQPCMFVPLKVKNKPRIPIPSATNPAFAAVLLETTIETDRHPVRANVAPRKNFIQNHL